MDEPVPGGQGPSGLRKLRVEQFVLVVSTPQLGAFDEWHSQSFEITFQKIQWTL